MRTLFLTVALILGMVCVACATVPATLIWDMDDMNTITGFEIYRGSQPGVYDQPVLPVGITGCVTGTPTVCTHTFDVPSGVWYFAVKSVAGADKSIYSNEVFKKYFGNPKNTRTK